MPKVHYVKKARKDNPAVKAGEPYYWWKFRYGGKRFSKTYPKASELTQSSFLQAYYDIQEMSAETIEEVDMIIEQIQVLSEETQSSLDNMPDHLQDTSDSGILLQERIAALEEWESELEDIKMQMEDWYTDENEDEDEPNWSDLVSEADPGLE